MNDALSLEYSLLEKYSSLNPYWAGSPFEKLVCLPADLRGRFGEDWLHQRLTAAGINNTWLADKNTDPTDGIYDLTVAGKRVEVKTASITVCNNSFQHEGLHTGDMCDFYVFLDIEYNTITVTVMSSEFFTNELCKDTSKLGATPHLRKNTTDVYKFDFSMKTMRQLKELGMSCTFDLTDPDLDDLSLFLTLTLS